MGWIVCPICKHLKCPATSFKVFSARWRQKRGFKAVLQHFMRTFMRNLESCRLLNIQSFCQFAICCRISRSRLFPSVTDPKRTTPWTPNFWCFRFRDLITQYWPWNFATRDLCSIFSSSSLILFSRSTSALWILPQAPPNPALGPIAQCSLGQVRQTGNFTTSLL